METIEEKFWLELIPVTVKVKGKESTQGQNRVYALGKGLSE
jgi:hypothetical protein